ncbi:MAG TPA: aspartate kinase [Gemmatimonadaceae bacterium]
MIVIKFGGTSVEDAAAITRAAEIVRGRLGRRPVVVVSALARVTNELLAIADEAALGNATGSAARIAAVRERHHREACVLLGAGTALDATREAISDICDEVAHLCQALVILRHAPPRSLDAIAAAGERLSSLLVTAAFRARGIRAREVDARALITTTDAFTRAEPVWERIAEQVPAALRPIIDAGEVPVLGGFIGSTATGITTTLGRGGGDYSAALVGAALGAEAIEIWTDVDGMLTADPRVVDGVRHLERLHFEEAAELATFGAKVLHPSTIAPAAERGIPVSIHNAHRPDAPGTRISSDAPRRVVTAIAGRAGICVVKVHSSRMLLARGFLHELFGVFSQHGLAVDVVTTSEVSVSATIEEQLSHDELVSDLAELGEVEVIRGCAIVAVVGSELTGNVDIVARALSALRGMPVHMLSVSATGTNVTAVIDGGSLPRAMRAVHEELFGGNPAVGHPLSPVG